MKWSRDLRAAARGLRTALRAASTMAAPPVTRHLTPRNQATQGGGDLLAIADFGADPAGLSMLAYRPHALTTGAPLVVMLHGCGQEPIDFAAQSGWQALADLAGLALVLPTQSADNNRQRCFNWFRPAETARGHGEARAIRAMVAEAARRFGSDPRAVFILGLSAGGAMAAAMLAAYPDVFAAGASIAGLPVGAAGGVASALSRMAQAGPDGRSPAEWADQVRHAAPAGNTGPWPRLSIWHGGLDTVVDPANAGLLATQWRTLHGLQAAPATVTEYGMARQESWGNATRPVVELWNLPAMPHGYPIVASGLLVPSAVLSAGVSATDHIAAFWRLT